MSCFLSESDLLLWPQRCCASCLTCLIMICHALYICIISLTTNKRRTRLSKHRSVNFLFYPKLKRTLFFLVHKHRLRWHLEAAERRHRAEERRDGHRAQEHEGEGGVQGRRPSAGRPDAVATDLVCSCGVLWVFCSRNTLPLHLMLLSDTRWGQQDVTFNGEGATGKGLCKSEYCLSKSRDLNRWGSLLLLREYYTVQCSRTRPQNVLSYVYTSVCVKHQPQWLCFQPSAQARSFLRWRTSLQPAARWTEDRSCSSPGPTSLHSPGLFSLRRGPVGSLYINVPNNKAFTPDFLFNQHVLPPQMEDRCGKWMPELFQRKAVE